MVVVDMVAAGVDFMVVAVGLQVMAEVGGAWVERRVEDLRGR